MTRNRILPQPGPKRCPHVLSTQCLHKCFLSAVRGSGRSQGWRRPALWATLALPLVLGGCATVGHGQSSDSADGSVYDPLESYNRAVFKFNDQFDRFVLKPAAKGYTYVLPVPVRNGITRFFNNLLEPTVIVNDLLQGKIERTASDTGRFVVNSTIGVAGLFDPARRFGLRPHEADFGMTLGVWGAPPGPYIVWPILGASDLRDSFGMIADYYTYPVDYLNSNTARWSLRVLDAVNTRANLLGTSSVLEQAAGPNMYSFVREAYMQQRLNLIYNGNPPQPSFSGDEPLDDSGTSSGGTSSGGAAPAVPATTPAKPSP
ncbi:MAG: MlaA family lipoprotein [Acidiferrobacterales bacterium]